MISNILVIFLFIFCKSSACPTGWYQAFSNVNRCYTISTYKLSWADAENYCRNTEAPNAHLTSILSAFEANEISTLVATNNPSIGQNDQVWIGAKGANDDEIFRWVDGNSVDYTNWLIGEPNLHYPCVSSLSRTGGKWRTESCETKNFFVCKYIMLSTPTPSDCFDWNFANGNSSDGIYRIYPSGSIPFDVFCDMNTDGGGWTVFQKRADSNLMFYNRTWMEYKLGFNNGLENSLWLGNDKIHLLSTKDTTVELRIDIWGDRWLNSTAPNGYWFDKYTFFVGNETSFYTLHVILYLAGNASAEQRFSIYYNSGMKFSTADVDNDNYDGVESCANSFQTGGWWYNDCTSVSLNGKYEPPVWHNEYGFMWYLPESFFTNPRQSRMMLRKSLNNK